MDIITAKNVIAYATQPDSLDMEVAFAHLPDQFIPFTARKDDSAAHGRELYVRAMFGEFGDIQTRVPRPMCPVKPSSSASSTPCRPMRPCASPPCKMPRS